MSAFDNAQRFFHACETPLGWEGCKSYVAEAATFVAQSEPLTGVNTVQAYCEWIKGFGTVTAAGAHYELHAQGYDDVKREAFFFATYHATHVGEGGPVPATDKTTHAHYVYVLTMDANDQVAHMVKVWNASWAMRELGWV